MNKFFKVGALALAIGFSCNAAQAAGLKALFLGGDAVNYVDQIRQTVIGSDARFDQAGSASAFLGDGNPTLSYLQQFDTVLVWTNSGHSDTTTLSNTLADYVDAGGGVVISTFWGQQIDNGHEGGGYGRLNDTGYNPLTNPIFDAYNAHTLGVYNALDPLMQGVSTLSANTFNADYAVGLDAGATLVASWDDDRPLAAYNAAHNVAAVTIFPNFPQYNHVSGDYAQLFANALAFTGSSEAVAPVPEPGTWALMIVGFGATGGLLRNARRRGLAA